MKKVLSILVFVSLIGCGDHGRTQALTAAGKNAATQLASYYDHFTTITTEWWAYQTTYNTLQGIPANQDLERLMNERLIALQGRVTMASRLADVYDNLAQLQNPKSTQPVVEAAQNLGKAISSTPRLPGGADLATGFGQAGDYIIGLKRGRDVMAANKALTEALKHINNAFLHERNTYESFIRDHDKTRAALVQSLERRNLATPNPPLDRLRLNVTWTNDDPDITRALALNMDAITMHRHASAWACATDETATMLQLLVAAHEQLATKELPAPAPLQRATARITVCLAQGEQP